MCNKKKLPYIWTLPHLIHMEKTIIEATRGLEYPNPVSNGSFLILAHNRHTMGTLYYVHTNICEQLPQNSSMWVMG